MDFDRRTLLLATSLVLTSACAKANGEKITSKGTGHSALAELSPAALEEWGRFKVAYLRRDGRIVDTGNGDISHSEGQGYGMLLAERADDPDAFDSLFAWTEKILARKDIALYSWRYAPAEALAIADTNNATDGDILIAWALMRAHRRWHRPAYARRAAQIRAAISAKLIYRQAGRVLLLPALAGFVAPERITVNPSYYIWPALDLFREADGAAGSWAGLIADGERLAREARFGPARLPCDWIDVLATGNVVPAAGKPPRFGFDAVRVPLYQVIGRRRPLTDEVAAYWRSLVDRRTPIPAWVDVLSGEQAPYPLSAGGMAIVRRVIDRAPSAETRGIQRDYYSDALLLLAQL